MVKHVVMWKVKREGGEKNNIEKIVTALLALRGKIPQIISLEAGENFSTSPNAYDIALIVTVENRKALDEYRNHPEHKKVVELIKQLTTEVAVVDFES